MINYDVRACKNCGHRVNRVVVEDQTGKIDKFVLKKNGQVTTSDVCQCGAVLSLENTAPLATR
jgi:hypothetical protein